MLSNTFADKDIRVINSTPASSIMIVGSSRPTFIYPPQEVELTMPAKIENLKTKEEIKKFIIKLFKEKQNVKISDLVEKYKIDLETSIEVLCELEKNGSIKAKK